MTPLRAPSGSLAAQSVPVPPGFSPRRDGGTKLRVLDLFAGIGGFSLGLEHTGGFSTIAFCEIEPFPRKVLAKHWPGVPIFDDVRELRGEDVGPVDVICGGFPCQDISVAGNQAGIEEGTRSGLWSECARLLGEIRPKYAIFENVTALLNGGGGDWFKRVLWDISEVGYDAEWHCIPASELGAHHHRDRIWIIAYPKGIAEGGLPVRKEEEFSVPGIPCKDVADSQRQRQQGQGQYEQSIFAEAFKNRQTINAFSGGTPDIWRLEPELGRVANGISERSHRLKGLGNAVVPQIPEAIGRAIMNVEKGAE